MENLLTTIRQIIADAQQGAIRSVNHALTVMYWQIGRVIVEEEQHGHSRAAYGTSLIKALSASLVAEYGENFTARNLNLSRQLYLAYPIVNSLSSQLTWTHHRLLMRLHDLDLPTEQQLLAEIRRELDNSTDS